MADYLIGLDNGGTVIKAALFDMAGRELAVDSRRTPLQTPRPGYTERDMETVWQTNCQCVRSVLEKSGLPAAQVAGLAVGGHGKGLYAWGRAGKPAYSGIVSTDNRAWKYPEKWRGDGTWQELYPRLCQQLIPGQPAALLAWLRQNEPEAYHSIQWVFSVKDYVRFRLTGEAYSEVTDLSGSGLMDVRNARLDPAIPQALGIPEVNGMLPPLRFSHQLCGALTADAARLCGLLPGTPVAGGMFDIDACALAVDVTDPDTLCTITGTWSINEFIAKQPALGTGIAMNSLYAIPGHYLIEECSPTSAGNLEWVLQNLAGGLVPPDGTRLYDHVDQLVSTIPPQNSDVYFLPFLYGSNAHPLGKGSFVGLTSFHTTADILRAVYEGVAYSAKNHIDKLLAVRDAPAAVRMAGGVANSAVWVQMFADVLGLPIETVSGVRELGALGCAMSAAVAVGCYADYPAAAKAMVRVDAPVPPSAERHAVYQRKYQKYNAVKTALDAVWRQFEV